MPHEPDVVFQTGDPEIDEIERRLAAGEDPDVVLAGWGDGEGDKVELPQDVEDDFENELEEQEPEATAWR